MLERLFSLEHRRRKLLKEAPVGPLRDFLAVPFPSPREDCRDVEYVAMDLETTGVDPREDEIISFGLVCLTGRSIDLSTAQHRLVAPTREIPETSAVIHAITDERAASGEPLAPVLTQVLKMLAGKVLVAHHARFEVQFMKAACMQIFGGRFLIPVVDTQAITRRWLERRNMAYGPKDLRLGALRERYNLPRYPAHNALSDALSAAEVFLAQLAQGDSGQARRLREFLVNVG